MQTQQTWDHLGVAITLNEKSGEFNAKVGLKNLKAPSLAAMRKKITDEKKVEIKPFPVIIPNPANSYSPDSGQIEEAQVVSVDRVKGTLRYTTRDFEFKVRKEGGYNRTDYNVILDTPANRKAVQTYLDLCRKNEMAVKALRDEIEQAKRALPYTSADDVALGKVKVIV